MLALTANMKHHLTDIIYSNSISCIFAISRTVVVKINKKKNVDLSVTSSYISPHENQKLISSPVVSPLTELPLSVLSQWNTMLCYTEINRYLLCNESQLP